MAHTKRQLAELAALLVELPAENDGMLLSEFDGFVAGLLVCPELILPGEWLPVVWGAENAPTFENIGQAQATINAVMAHYNSVARALGASDPEYEAVFDSDPANGEIVWGPGSAASSAPCACVPIAGKRRWMAMTKRCRRRSR